MTTRAYNKDAASLIASGPRGCIHFWNVFQGGQLLAKFKGVCVQSIGSIQTVFTVDYLPSEISVEQVG